MIITLKLTLASGATALGSAWLALKLNFSIRRYRARFCIITLKLTLASGATALGSAWHCASYLSKLAQYVKFAASRDGPKRRQAAALQGVAAHHYRRFL
jgi:hypothetical protein